MIGATFCSGIGAPEAAAPWVDWRFASEIEPFPRAVLSERFGYREPGDEDSDHYPGDPLLWGDMSDVTPDIWRDYGIPLPDLIVAGTPCQSFSVAGLRRGTADARGNLTLKFVEIAHAIVNARPDGRLCVLWENVPGVLSDKGNAFGCFLGGLIGSVAPIVPAEPIRNKGPKQFWRWNAPKRWRDRGRRKHRKGFWSPVWPGEGMVQGPRARAAWATLDAQWFGVAQRRRRVLVVVDFGGCVDPAAILLEPESLRGDSAPRREAGENPAPTISARPTGGGGLRTDFDLDGGLIASTGDVAHCLNAGAMGRIDYETETMVAHTLLAKENDSHAADLDTYVTHALRGEGFDASEDGTGRGTPLVPVAIQERAVSENLDAGPGGKGFQENLAYTLEARNKVQAVAFAQNQRGEVRLSDVSPQLTCGGGKPGEGYPAIAFDCKGTEVQYSTDGTHPTLRSMGHNNSHQNAGGHAAVAFDLRGRDGGSLPEGPHDTANIRAADGGSSRSYIATPWAVRRLMPVECARLQGFSDDHTQIIYRGKPAADGPQYKAYGNSMAVPKIRWILERIRDGWVS